MSSPKDVPDAVHQARDWLRQQTGREPRRGVEFRKSEGRREVESHSPSSLDPIETRRPEACGPAAQDPDPRLDAATDPIADLDADTEEVARAILVRKLAAQDCTRHELAAALAARNVPAEVVDELLDRFEEVGLVDDETFARRWVESRQGRRHRSRLALRRELAGKGVDRVVVDEALSQVSNDDELDAARAYCDKVVGGMSGLDPLVRRRRLADRLARRGFGAEVIGRVLKDSAPQ